MNDILGLQPLEFLAVAGVLIGLTWWWLARTPKLVHGTRVHMTVYCLHCNWESLTTVSHPRCNRCGSTRVNVLNV